MRINDERVPVRHLADITNDDYVPVDGNTLSTGKIPANEFAAKAYVDGIVGDVETLLAAL